MSNASIENGIAGGFEPSTFLQLKKRSVMKLIHQSLYLIKLTRSSKIKEGKDTIKKINHIYRGTLHADILDSCLSISTAIELDSISLTLIS